MGKSLDQMKLHKLAASLPKSDYKLDFVSSEDFLKKAEESRRVLNNMYPMKVKFK